MNFKEPIPAFVKRNGYEGHVMVTAYLTGIRSLKIPGPGAVAHMSLHLNQQCQRADRQKWRTTNVPRFDPGDWVSVYVGDRGVGGGRNRQHPVGGVASKGGP